jgi:predicted nucleic acid-binding protein
LTLLLDASVLLAAFDRDDEHREPAAALLIDPDLVLLTLDLARYEVANVAVRSWRTPDAVAPLLEAIEQLTLDGGVIASGHQLLLLSAQFADQHQISVYDAAYVAAAAQHEATLVSCDERDLVSAELALLPGDALAS